MHTIVDYTSKIKSYFSSKQELTGSNAYQSKIGVENLIQFPYADNTKINAGITWTVNADRSVTANGISTGYSFFDLTKTTQFPKLKAGTYILSRMPDDLNTDVKIICRANSTSGGETKTYGYCNRGDYPLIFTVTQEDADKFESGEFTLNIRLFANASTTLSEYSVLPILRCAEDIDGTMQLVAMTNRELSNKVNGFSKSVNGFNGMKKINITDFGGAPYVNTSANSQKLVQAIEYAMTNGYTLYVPKGIYTIKEPIIVTHQLIIEGATTFGQKHPDVGSVISFAPQSDDKTLFSDNGTQQYISIEHIVFNCSYAHFSNPTGFSYPNTEIQETPHLYFTWTYDYNNVNCMNFESSIISLNDVFIRGFSGYGLLCNANATVNDIHILTCKYGFYNCKTDTIFNTCYVTQCEKAFYWHERSIVLLAYDTWIDQCGYGLYSDRGLNGTFTGLIDHCLYAAIYSYSAANGLSIDARIGRCGMYYTGTDMLTRIPQTYTDEAFEDMSKGVFIAIRYGKAINLRIDAFPRPIDDQGQGERKLPTLLVFGKQFESAVIKTAYDFGERTYRLTDNATSQVLVTNCASISNDTLKTVVAASSDFADFQTRIAAL